MTLEWVWSHLPGLLHLDGNDMEPVAAELAGPGATLADPFQEALLVGVADRPVTSTRVQQLPLLEWGRGGRGGQHR